MLWTESNTGVNICVCIHIAAVTSIHIFLLCIPSQAEEIFGDTRRLEVIFSDSKVLLSITHPSLPIFSRAFFAPFPDMSPGFLWVHGWLSGCGVLLCR